MANGPYRDRTVLPEDEISPREPDKPLPSERFAHWTEVGLAALLIVVVLSILVSVLFGTGMSGVDHPCNLPIPEEAFPWVH